MRKRNGCLSFEKEWLLVDTINTYLQKIVNECLKFDIFIIVNDLERDEKENLNNYLKLDTENTFQNSAYFLIVDFIC